MLDHNVSVTFDFHMLRLNAACLHMVVIVHGKTVSGQNQAISIVSEL